MSRCVTAIYDGAVLRPEVPLDLERDARYVITVQPVAPSSEGGDAWDLLASLAGTLDPRADWAAGHDHYLSQTRDLPADDR